MSELILNCANCGYVFPEHRPDCFANNDPHILKKRITELEAEVERLKSIPLNINNGKVCTEHHAEEATYCPYCMLKDYQDEFQRIAGMCQMSVESGLILSERVRQEYLEYQHDLARFKESEQSLAEELIDALKRAEQAESKLSRYEQGVEVEGIIDLWECCDWSQVIAEVPSNMFADGQRVRVLVTAIEPIAVPDHIVDVNKMVEEDA